MKLSPQLVLTAQLAALAACEYMPEGIMDVTTRKILNGTEALDYLFKYDPSRPHSSDGDFSASGPPDDAPVFNFKYRNYDANYLGRVCNPRFSSEEASENVNWDFMENIDMTVDKYMASYDYSLNLFRQFASGTPYPCERMGWIIAECGINSFIFDGVHAPGKGTPKEQNDCLCKSDYWAAYEACTSCYVLHTGNKTLGEEDASLRSAVSEAVCAETGTVTMGIFEYWSSQYPSDAQNTTIISDGAQNQTDVSFYYTGGVDFVPATIQEPAFTRTIGEETVVMTPGALAAKGTAAATGGSATGSSAAGVRSEAAAADIRVRGGILVAAFGAFMLV